MLLTVGLNHNTAPLAVRETVAFPPDQVDAALDGLVNLPDITEGAILSTCNRTELYAVAANDTDGEQLQHWLCDQRGLERGRMAEHFYVYRDRDSIRHALRVAAGLDSMVVGEPQILGQMKDAYRQARAARGTGPLLTRLFEHSFATAKQIRTQTGIGAYPVSVAYAGVNLARNIFADLSTTSAMLLGAGETIELGARYLQQLGVHRMVFANRSFERAQTLATQHHGYAIALADASARLAEADILVTSTAAPHTIVGHDDLKNAVRQRRHKPVFVLDLAVPRDVDPQAAELEDIYLYTVDDLEGVIQDNHDSRHAAARQADTMLDARVDEYYDWLESRRANEVISAMRSQAHATREALLERARRELARGREPEAVLEHFGHALTNKLLHTPSATLRDSRGAEQCTLLDSASKLYRLEADKPEENSGD